MPGATDRSARRLPTAGNAKPAWLNNLSMDGLPVKAQAAIKKEIGALARAGVFKPLKKAAKLDVLAKAVTMGSVKKGLSVGLA